MDGFLAFLEQHSFPFLEKVLLLLHAHLFLFTTIPLLLLAQNWGKAFALSIGWEGVKLTPILNQSLEKKAPFPFFFFFIFSFLFLVLFIHNIIKFSKEAREKKIGSFGVLLFTITKHLFFFALFYESALFVLVVLTVLANGALGTFTLNWGGITIMMSLGIKKRRDW